jgi:PAS domain S-box-containing protein
MTSKAEQQQQIIEDQDITSHIKDTANIFGGYSLEDQLRNSLFSMATSEAIAIHKDGLIVDANEQFPLMFGYTKSEVIGKHFSIFSTPESLPVIAENIKRKFDGFYEALGVKKDGSLLPAELRGTTLIHEGEEIRVAIFRDLTERKKIKAELVESEKRFRDISYNMADWIWEIDTNFRYTYTSGKVESILGYSSEEMLGKTPFALMPKDEAERVNELLQETLSKKKAFKDLVNLNISKEGKDIYLSTSAVPMYDDKGTFTGYRGVNKDITESRNIEMELNHYRENLESIVEKRTADLQTLNSKLNSTLTELERSNTELEQFAYVASHDLQEPLRKIKNFADLLEMRYTEQLDDKARKYIDYMVNGAERMQGLISDLLTYSRVSTQGKKMKEVSLENILNHAIDNLELSIQESNATILFENLPVVIADETQMIQLFQNLLGNAIKFRKEEEALIQINFEKTASEWHISVSDNGIGIEPEYQDRIFEVFQRLHTREEYAGTGIGLAVCKKIVERHGGRIWLESTYKEGSSFHFTLALS